MNKPEEKQPIKAELVAVNQETLLEKVIARSASIVVTERGIDFENFTGLLSLANMILKSRMHPTGLDSLESIALAIARGRTVGLDAFQSMESMAVINGRVMIWGDAPLAIARQHPLWDESGFSEFFEVGGERIKGNPTKWTDDVTHVSISLRKGAKEPYESRFSVLDAKTAKLWDKKNSNGSSGPWTFYPQRLLKFRSRGYGLRDNFGDALKGILIRELFEPEEVEDEYSKPKVVSLQERVEKEKPKQESAIQDLATPAGGWIAEPQKTVQNTIESIKTPNPPVTTSEPPKTQARPDSAPIPRKRNESPAFNSARTEIMGFLAKINEPEKIKEEILYECSHDPYDGDFLTLSDVEDGVGKLPVFQRAAGNLKQRMKDAVPF